MRDADPALPCPTCGFANPAGMRFCGRCGASLALGSGEERKVVTLLFADVVASTRLAAALDPERLRAQMAHFFQIARDEVERYGGTVEKFIGDAVLAVFGLPAVHEDDAERAARAALAIRDRMIPYVQDNRLSPVRIGVATGEVVANPGAADMGEFLVTGEPVNLAARLQQHAAAGQILLGQRTAGAVRALATLRPVEPLAVKGHEGALSAWELAAIAPPSERAMRGTPFVARREELALLQGHLGRMLRDLRGHLITILGPAGVGKTRLVHEFCLAAAPVHVVRGRALPYGTGVPFSALGEAIRRESGILLDDTRESARSKLGALVRELDVEAHLPALYSVLGLAEEERSLPREALFAGMRAFFHALAHRSPLILVLEDVHSAEDVTLDYLEQAADWVREAPLMLLVVSRLELLERRAGWMGGRPAASALLLDPLGEHESRALMEAILGTKSAPPPLAAMLLRRSGGNPLFMEELLRILIERGVLLEEENAWRLVSSPDDAVMPETVHGVIAARIDGLPPPEKLVLQAAAVAGKDFWLGVVRAVLGEDGVEGTLADLVRKDLVLRHARSSLSGEEEFTFRHILFRDVAYAMIPKAQRWERHARCARWLAGIAGDRQTEYADFIAHHWMQVVTLRRELGMPRDRDVEAQAITNLLLAADRAAGVYANAAALDHYSRLLDLEPEPEIRLRALLGRGEVWMLLGQFDGAREDFAAVRASARKKGLPRWEAVALDHLGHSFRRQDQIEPALAHLQPALALAREAGDAPLAGRILNHIGFTLFSDGRHGDASRAHEEARGLLEQAEDLPGLAESLHGLGENQHFMGRFSHSIESLDRSRRLSLDLGDRSLAAENLFMIAHSHMILGEYKAARAEAAESLATLLEIGDVWNTCPAYFINAEVAGTLGEFGAALEYAQRGHDAARQLAAVRFRVYNMMAQARLHRELEDHGTAWRLDREATGLAREVGGAWLEGVLAGSVLDALGLGHIEEAEAAVREARASLERSETQIDLPLSITHAEGSVALAQGRPADALARADRMLDAIAARQVHRWTAPALLLRGDALAGLDRRDDAAGAYRAAAADADQRGCLPTQWRALARLADLALRSGREEDAARDGAQAREIAERLAQTVRDERLRAVFLQSACIQRLPPL